MQNTADCQNLSEKKCQSFPQLMKEQRDATKHVQDFNNSQWFWRYFGFLTTSQPSSAICSWCLPAIPCAVLITAVFIWCQLKYAAIIKIFYFKASLSAHGQNVWVSSTMFLLETIIIIKKGKQLKSSQLVLGVQRACLSWFWEERGFCWLGSAIQGVLWNSSPPAHGTDTGLAAAPGAGPPVLPIPVMWLWLPLPILPLGGSLARPPAWAASPFSRTIKSELLFPKGKCKLWDLA